MGSNKPRDGENERPLAGGIDFVYGAEAPASNSIQAPYTFDPVQHVMELKLPYSGVQGSVSNHLVTCGVEGRGILEPYGERQTKRKTATRNPGSYARADPERGVGGIFPQRSRRCAGGRGGPQGRREQTHAWTTISATSAASLKKDCAAGCPSGIVGLADRAGRSRGDGAVLVRFDLARCGLDSFARMGGVRAGGRRHIAEKQRREFMDGVLTKIHEGQKKGFIAEAGRCRSNFALNDGLDHFPDCVPSTHTTGHWSGLENSRPFYERRLGFFCAHLPRHFARGRR